jgi:hypothetical protein
MLPDLQWLIWALAAGALYASTVRSLGSNAAVLMVIAFAYYLYWYYYHSHFAYTNDIEGHTAYAAYLQGNILDAFSYKGSEEHHPPTYYGIAALWLLLAQDWLQFGFHGALRILSLLMYVPYCVFAIRTVRLFNTKNNLAYLGYVLILFWPLSILMATRITNDVLVYTLWSAFFYYCLRWVNQSRHMDMVISIMLAALCLMVKTTGIALFGILGLCILYRLFTRQTLWRELVSPWMFVSYALVLGSVFVNLSKTMVGYLNAGRVRIYLGNNGKFASTIDSLLTFDVFAYIADPYIGYFNLDRQPDGFTYFAKSLLYGEFVWRYNDLASAVNASFILFLVVIIAGLVWGLRTRRLSWARMYPLMLMLVIPYVMIVGFVIRQRLPQCMDARFIYPIVIPLIILFTQVLDALQAAGHIKLYRLSVIIGFALPLLGTLHYLAHYLIR